MFILIFYTLGVKMINNNDFNFLFKVKSVVPNSLKHFLKNTIFIVPTLKKTINELQNENKILKSNLKKESKEITELDNNDNFVLFNQLFKEKEIQSKFYNYNFTVFETNDLRNGKADQATASGYIEEFKDKILIATGDGKFLYFNKDQLNKKNFKSNVIKSNISEIINYPEFYSQSKFGVKDVLIDGNKLFVSYSNEVIDDNNYEDNVACYNTAIIVAKIDLNYLNFRKFFTPKECVKKINEYGSFNAHIAGGRIVKFKENQILFSTGAFQFSTHAQNKENIFGKILSINKISGEWNIISLGHRNVQGLEYDVNKNIIYSTEHGPIGGDEFNINFSPNIEKVKNYGWPIASYGEHYGGNKSENKWKYEKAPLKKSHKKNGFIEPIKYFVPSIGISEIKKIPKKFNEEFNNDFFISSMGTKKEEGDLSIHHLSLNENLNKIIKHDVIFIGERIRDLKYIKDLNKILLFIENSPGLGILSY